MSGLLNITEFTTKTFDGKSYEPPSKLQITSRTVASLENNLKNYIDIVVDRWNKTYSKLVSAVEISEKIKAEEAAKNKMLGIAELETIVKNNKIIARITTAEEVKKRLNRVSAELLELSGRIGTLNGNYGINVKKGFAQKPPKAISVKKLCVDVCRELMKKIALYKIVIKEGLDIAVETETVPIKEEKKESKTANWRNLFDGIKIPDDLTVVATRKEETETEGTPVVKNSLDDDTFRSRKLIAQIGDELEYIENLLNSPNGVPYQFQEGILQRREKLVKMLSNLTGIESNIEKTIEIPYKNTPLQDIIDREIGYKEPLSDEEHQREEERLEAYYETAADDLSRLLEKDTVYIFNQGMDSILEAEKKANEKHAEEVIEKSNNEIEKINQERILTENTKEEEAVRTLNGYVEMKERNIEQEAKEAARDIFERNQIYDAALKESIAIAGHNAAVKIYELNKIADAAYETAIKLLARNTAIDINDYNEVLRLAENAAINISAYNEAVRIHDLNNISKTAYEEAMKIFENNKNIELEEKNRMAQTAGLYAVIHASENKMKELEKERDNIDLSLASIKQKIDEYNKQIKEVKEESGIVQTPIDLNYFQEEPTEEQISEDIKKLAYEAAREIFVNNSKMENDNNEEAEEEIKRLAYETAREIFVNNSKMENDSNEEAEEEIKKLAYETAKEIFANNLNTETVKEEKVETPAAQIVSDGTISFIQVNDRFAEQHTGAKKILAQKVSVDEMRKNGNQTNQTNETNQTRLDYSDTNSGILMDMQRYLESLEKPVAGEIA